MKKNGFTLVELLAVIVLIAIITSIGSFSVIAINKKIKEDMWNSKVALIEERAKAYGDDHKNLLTGTCTVDETTYDKCLTIDVQRLLEKKYLTTKDTCKKSDNDYCPTEGNKEVKVIINDTKSEDEEGYYANKMKINIYLENNMVYAKLMQTE